MNRHDIIENSKELKKLLKEDKNHNSILAWGALIALGVVLGVIVSLFAN